MPWLNLQTEVDVVAEASQIRHWTKVIQIQICLGDLSDDPNEAQRNTNQRLPRNLKSHMGNIALRRLEGMASSKTQTLIRRELSL